MVRSRTSLLLVLPFCTAYLRVPTVGIHDRPMIVHKQIMIVASEQRENLKSLLSTVPNRGLDEYEEWKPPPAYVTDMEEAVEALLPLDPSRGDWMIDDNFEGSWRLAYTSSLMFRSNEGLSGYGYYVEGVSTPELIMRIGSTKLTFEEPLDEESAGALATYLRLLEPPDAVRVHCSWQAGGDDSLKCTFEQIEVGSKAWKPANAAEQGEVDFGQDKAIRVMGNTKPVYLDDQVLVLRALTDAFFVLLKA